MRIKGRCNACGILVSVVGGVQAIGRVTAGTVAAYLVAITARNLSPLWAGKELLDGCPDGVRILITWFFSESGHSISAELVKEGGQPRLEGGGLGYDGSELDVDGQSPGEVKASVSGSIATRVEYGPKQIMRWLAEASEGPEQVGETEPLKTVPESPGEGHRGGGANGFGDVSDAKHPVWG